MPKQPILQAVRLAAATLVTGSDQLLSAVGASGDGAAPGNEPREPKSSSLLTTDRRRSRR